MQLLAGLPGGEGAGLVEHPPHGQVVRPGTGLRTIPVDEEELPHAVRGGREQVAPEPEDVAVPGVDARDRTSTHEVDLVGHGDAGDGGATDVVVGDQERRRDARQHADLVADVA